jgi:hypothetical protein
MPKLAAAPAKMSKLAAAPAQTEGVVNSPERANGRNPDEHLSATPDNSAPKTTHPQRADFACAALQGLVAARAYSTTDKRYAVSVAKDAVELADALIEALR